jgi:hypothetical protein
MSRPLGGYIGHRPTPATAATNSAAGGMWTLREAQRFKQGGTWPTVGAPQQTWVQAIVTDGAWDSGPPGNASRGTPERVTNDNSGDGAGAVGANYLQIDLGQTRTITGVYVRGLTISGYWSSVYAAGRIISVGLNDQNFTTYGTTGTAQELTSLQLYSYGVVQARYIRLSPPIGGFLAVSEFYPRG